MGRVCVRSLHVRDGVKQGPTPPVYNVDFALHQSDQHILALQTVDAPLARIVSLRGGVRLVNVAKTASYKLHFGDLLKDYHRKRIGEG